MGLWHVPQGRAAGEQQATGWATNGAGKDGELGVRVARGEERGRPFCYKPIGILVSAVDRGRISMNARYVFDGTRICIVCVLVGYCASLPVPW